MIFNTDWDEFPFLFFFNTDNYYIVGLDKLYMIHYDEEKYELWRKICSGRVEKPSETIWRDFGASYVIADTRARKAFIVQAANDPNMKLVYPPVEALLTEKCFVFRVVPP